MYHRLKHQGKKGLMVVLVLALLASNFNHLSASGIETAPMDSNFDDVSEEEFMAFDSENGYEGLDGDDFSALEVLEEDFEDDKAEEVQEVEEVEEDPTFECHDDVCYWTQDMNEHENDVIAVNDKGELLDEDEEGDYHYISVEAFKAANTRLARSNWTGNTVGNITIPTGTWSTNGWNRTGNVTIPNGAHLIIPTTSQGGTQTVITGVITIEAGGTLTMNGGTINFATAAADRTGRAVMLPENTSTLNMNGGTINGRVRIGSDTTTTGGVFNMSGGTVNSGTFIPGQDDMNASGTALASGVRNNEASVEIGAIIHNNGVTGAVGNDARGVFNMSGGVITGNRNRGISAGGRNVVIHMTGGSIQGNAGNIGGGIRARFHATILMEAPNSATAPQITNNIGTTHFIENPSYGGGGGGVAISYGTSFEMRGGSIYGNQTEYSSGGGVSVWNSSGQGINGATFVMTGGSIHNNTALVRGGGINVTGGANSSVILKGTAVVRDNTATIGDGGGVYVGGTGQLTVSENAMIHDNVALGDEFAAATAFDTFRTNSNILHARISQPGVDNTNLTRFVNDVANAGHGGGVAIDVNASFTMNAGQLNSNIAMANGGGLYVGSTGATFTATGGSISDNHAGEHGGGIWTASYEHSRTLSPGAYGNLDISSSVVFGGNSAGQGSYPPPSNWQITSIRGNGTSPSLVEHQVHQLNNDDVNYRFGEPSIKMNTSDADLTIGQSTQIRATVISNDVAGVMERTIRNVTWSSSRPLVATVDMFGRVTARSLGTTVITARTIIGGRVFTSTSTVRITSIPVRSISLSSVATSVEINRTVALRATILPANATNRSVTWQSSNSNIASVDGTGRVTGRRVGSVFITARTSNGLTSASIVVVQPTRVTGVRINGSSANLTVGNSRRLNAIVTPANAADRRVVWISLRPWVASVDQNGRVTGIRSGSASIMVITNDGGRVATITINVAIPVRSVRFNSSSTTIGVGSDRRLNPIVSPSNATDKSLTWSSSNPLIASVDRDGRVTGVRFANSSTNLLIGSYKTLRPIISPANATDQSVTWESLNEDIATVNANGRVRGRSVGTATIRVTTNDGGRRATIRVNVRPVRVTDVKFSRLSTTINVGSSRTLNPIITPSNATNRRVTWSSSNSNVVSVDANGRMTARRIGSATITVRTNDGGKKATIRVSVQPIRVTGVRFNSSSTDIVVGNSRTLNPIISPANATDRSVRWSSSNPSIATVDRNGRVTARSVGRTVITVTTNDGNHKATITVNVRAATLSLLGLSLRTVPAAANNFSVDVRSNTNWTVTSDVPWLTIPNLSSRSGNGSFRVNVSANTTGRVRTGIITVTAPGAPTRTIWITQGSSNLSLSRNSWNPSPFERSEIRVNVTADTTWSVEIMGNPHWLSIEEITPTSQRGNGSFRIVADANTTNNERSAIISIRAPGALNRSISVTQEGVVWHSDRDLVSFWPDTINVSTEIISLLPSYVDFSGLVTEARTAWNHVLGVPIGTSSQNNSQIHTVVGRRGDIEDEYRRREGHEFGNRQVAGVALTSLSPDPVRIRAGGRSRNVHALTGQARVYVVYESRFWNLDPQREQQGNREIMYMIILHELGHTLGYNGHAPNRNDVMYYRPYPPLRIHLTPNEHRHLRQIYDHFR